MASKLRSPRHELVALFLCGYKGIGVVLGSVAEVEVAPLYVIV